MWSIKSKQSRWVFDRHWSEEHNYLVFMTDDGKQVLITTSSEQKVAIRSSTILFSFGKGDFKTGRDAKELLEDSQARVLKWDITCESFVVMEAKAVVDHLKPTMSALSGKVVTLKELMERLYEAGQAKVRIFGHNMPGDRRAGELDQLSCSDDVVYILEPLRGPKRRNKPTPKQDPEPKRKPRRNVPENQASCSTCLWDICEQQIHFWFRNLQDLRGPNPNLGFMESRVYIYISSPCLFVEFSVVVSCVFVCPSVGVFVLVALFVCSLLSLAISLSLSPWLFVDVSLSFIVRCLFFLCSCFGGSIIIFTGVFLFHLCACFFLFFRLLVCVSVYLLVCWFGRVSCFVFVLLCVCVRVTFLPRLCICSLCL